MSDLELHNHLKSIWDQTPLMETIEHDRFKILLHENRKLILKAFNIGIIEPNFNYTRHILTAQEILKYLHENHNEDIKLNNVYFHVKQLENQDIIKEVIQKKTGKRPKSYYGRNAKIYLDSGYVEYDINEPFYQKLIELIKMLRPEIDESEIKKPFLNLYDMRWKNEERIIKNWFFTHKELLENVDIDDVRLFMFLAKLLDFSSDYKDSMKKISDFLLLNEN